MLRVMPERDQELARQGHDSLLALHGPGGGVLLVIPPGERALRLVLDPSPGDLDELRPHVPIARLRDAQLTLDRAALVWRGTEPDERAQLAPVVERPPREELHREQPGGFRPDAAHLQQPAYEVDPAVAGASQPVLSLALQLADLLVEQPDFRRLAPQP